MAPLFFWPLLFRPLFPQDCCCLSVVIAATSSLSLLVMRQPSRKLMIKLEILFCRILPARMYTLLLVTRWWERRCKSKALGCSLWMNRDVIGDGKIQNMGELDFRTKPGVGQVGKAEDAVDGQLPLLHLLRHHLVKISTANISFCLHKTGSIVESSVYSCRLGTS